MKIHFFNGDVQRGLFPAALAVFLFTTAGAQPTNFAASLSELRAQLGTRINSVSAVHYGA